MPLESGYRILTIVIGCQGEPQAATTTSKRYAAAALVCVDCLVVLRRSYWPNNGSPEHHAERCPEEGGGWLTCFVLSLKNRALQYRKIASFHVSALRCRPSLHELISRSMRVRNFFCVLGLISFLRRGRAFAVSCITAPRLDNFRFQKCWELFEQGLDGGCLIHWPG